MNTYIQYDKSSETIKFAASELEKHLKMLRIPLAFSSEHKPNSYRIRLYITKKWREDGLPEHSGHPADDQYSYCFGAEEGAIRGSNERSVLLGVYAFLRRIGYRFIRPGKNGTFIPKRECWEELLVQGACRAAYRHRGVCIEGANSLENILDFIDWLPKLGYNSFFMQFKTPYVFLERWYGHTGNPWREAEPFTEQDLKHADCTITQEIKKRSLLHHRVGHGWTSEAIGRPCYGWYKDETEISTEIRPLLAMIGGKRQFWQGIPSNTNLCYSNPEAVRRLVQCVADYAQQHAGIDYLHVWLADEYNNICECEDCRATTPSDQYVELLNAIDAELERRGVKTKIVFLLYQELLFAPKKARFQNPSRFILMFAPISRTFESSYPARLVPIALPEYRRNRIQLPVNIQENLSYLAQWQMLFDGDAFVYDYPLGRAHYGDLGYWKITQTIARDIQSLTALRMNGYVSCQELRAFSPTSLPNYVMGLMLEQPSLDFQKLCADYFETLYGAYGQTVREYLTRLSELSNTDYFNGKGPRRDADYHKRLLQMQTVLQDFQATLQKGSQSATEQQRYYWNLLDYHRNYGIHLIKAMAAMTNGDAEEADRLFTDFHAFICRGESDYQPSLDVYRITEVATKYTGFHCRKPGEGGIVCTEPKCENHQIGTVS